MSHPTQNYMKLDAWGEEEWGTLPVYFPHLLEYTFTVFGAREITSISYYGSILNAKLYDSVMWAESDRLAGA